METESERLHLLYQLHRRRVHAAEHLEENRDVGRIQGSFRQHGTQSLAGSRVGCCRTKSKGYLTGIMTPVTDTASGLLLTLITNNPATTKAQG